MPGPAVYGKRTLAGISRAAYMRPLHLCCPAGGKIPPYKTTRKGGLYPMVTLHLNSLLSPGFSSM